LFLKFENQNVLKFRYHNCISFILNFVGCPKELQVVGGDGYQDGVVGCKSACEAFGSDEYCCSGEFANPSTCQPSYYSTLFKQACPKAYSYAFDDATSTFICKAFEYDIVFCPNTNRYTCIHFPKP